MMQFLRYLFAVLLCVAFASVLSYVAFYGFWFAARLFHSVPAVRACDAIGRVILSPARFIFYCAGGFGDQSMPLADPVSYSITNGTFLGALIYIFARPVLIRNKKP